VAAVARLVRLTEHHDPAPDDEDGSALSDADLAVLAAAPSRYADYVAGVRQEYASVPEPAFRTGRAAVLRALVDRPHVFSTAYGRARWEPAARENVSRELASLAERPD
jgi:predicted metal-dependent HD superfamily phosphohydrolase